MSYVRPMIETLDAAEIRESMGPVQGYMMGQAVNQEYPVFIDGKLKR